MAARKPLAEVQNVVLNSRKNVEANVPAKGAAGSEDADVASRARKGTSVPGTSAGISKSRTMTMPPSQVRREMLEKKRAKQAAESAKEEELKQKRFASRKVPTTGTSGAPPRTAAAGKRQATGMRHAPQQPGGRAPAKMTFTPGVPTKSRQLGHSRDSAAAAAAAAVAEQREKDKVQEKLDLILAQGKEGKADPIELENLRVKIGIMDAKLVAADRELLDKSHELQEARLDINRKEIETIAKEQEIHQLLREEKEHAKKLDQELSTVNASVAALEADKRLVNSVLEERQKELESLRLEYSTHDSTIQSLRSEAAIVQESLKREQECKRKLEAELDENQSRLREIRRQVEIAQMDVEGKESELRKCVREKAAIESDRCQLEQSLATRTANLETERAALSDLRCEMESLKQKALTDRKTAEQEYEAFKAHMEARVESLESSKKSVELAKENVSNELQSALSDVSQFKSTLGSQENALLAIQSEKSSLLVRIEALQTDSMNKSNEISALELVKQEHLATIASFEEQARSDEALRRKLHNMVQELKGNIRVYCRIRPLLQKELAAPTAAAARNMFQYADRNLGLIIQPPLCDDANSGGSSADMQSKPFKFDHVFGPSASQEHVFEEISQLVQSALDGYRVCIFAYGQTGSGKTHTMIGDGSASGQSLGMIPRSVQQIFESSRHLAKDGWKFRIRASFLEIYNEEVRDLLANPTTSNPTPKSDTKHTITFDANTREISVSNLRVEEVENAEQVQALIKLSVKNRVTAATKSNERSSRSHSIFRLHIEGQNSISGQTLKGVLNLVDLAGSERLAVSKAEGQRLKETRHINKSLSALGDVMSSLANGAAHIPFRNSKLTRLLQDSLGGDSKALMFVNVSHAVESYNESLCSLRFGAKVNNVQLGTARRSANIDFSNN